MYEAVRKQYDSLYSKDDFTFGNGKPIKVLKRLSQVLVTGRVLDIGGGDGRNALYLARKGYDVTVIDLSEIGLEKLRAQALKENLSITTRVADVVTEDVSGEFDGVLFSFMLHHLDSDHAIDLIRKLQNQTSPKGIHIVTGFSNDGELYQRAKKSERFYPDEQTLSVIYKGWNVIEYVTKETTSLAKNKDGKHMKNKMFNFLTQNQ